MKSVRTFIRKGISGLLSGIMPVLHILISLKYWGKYSRRVDRRYCSCSCWDTVFKGNYESGVASYKHMYFNATSNTMKIWLLTVVSIIVLYECLKYELKLYFVARLRGLMALLFLSSLFSHYYAWWMFVNYWNDEFYSQWNHQLFFSITEIISTALVLHLSNSKVTVTPRKVLVITSIAVIHILTGCFDQFVKNVIFMEGQAHVVLRDLSFVIPDILQAILPIIEFTKNKKNNQKLRFLSSDLIYMIGFTLLGFFISINL